MTRWILIGPALAATAGAAQLALLCYIFFTRMAYPFDLEWMEGGMLCHALQLLAGRPLYGPPSADFISYLYTPLYPALVALLGKLFGVSYLLGRTISVVAFLGALVLVYRVITRETGGGWFGRLWAITGLGLIASSFQWTGAWYDLVRNDSLYLLLIMACLYLLYYHHRSWPGLIGAGVLAGLAFLTKQTASLFIIMSGLALLVINWRRLPVYVATVAAVAGGAVLTLNHLTEGWFWKYIYGLHQGHDLYWDRIWPVTELKLLKFSPVVGALLGLWLLVQLGKWVRQRRLEPGDGPRVFWFCVALTGVLVSAVGFATQWASANAFIPGLFFPALFIAMGGAQLSKLAAVGRRGAMISTVASLIIGGALAGQLLFQLYSPVPHLPRPEDQAAGQQLIALMKTFKGPILMPYHPFYPTLAGKEHHYHQMGINDVTRAGLAFPPDLRRRMMTQHYAAIILDNPPRGRYDFMLSQYKLQRYFKGAEVPHVVTGYGVRPSYLYVPKRPDPVPPGARRVFGFEEPQFAGWEVRGKAFGSRPAGGCIWNQGPVGPFEGSQLANSFHGGDRSQGMLSSPTFIVDRPVLTYRVGGGRLPERLEVKLLVDQRVVHRDTGSGSDIMELRRVDVSAYLGQQMRVELTDQAAGAWGHLLFDDLMLLNK